MICLSSKINLQFKGTIQTSFFFTVCVYVCFECFFVFFVESIFILAAN